MKIEDENRLISQENLKNESKSLTNNDSQRGKEL